MITTKADALREARTFLGKNAAVEFQAERDVPERKLKSGRIRKARHIEQKYTIGTLDDIVPGFGCFFILGESSESWDDALEKAKVERARELKYAEERKRRNRAKSTQ